MQLTRNVRRKFVPEWLRFYTNSFLIYKYKIQEEKELSVSYIFGQASDTGGSSGWGIWREENALTDYQVFRLFRDGVTVENEYRGIGGNSWWIRIFSSVSPTTSYRFINNIGRISADGSSILSGVKKETNPEGLVSFMYMRLDLSRTKLILGIPLLAVGLDRVELFHDAELGVLVGLHLLDLLIAQETGVVPESLVDVLLAVIDVVLLEELEVLVELGVDGALIERTVAGGAAVRDHTVDQEILLATLLLLGVLLVLLGLVLNVKDLLLFAQNGCHNSTSFQNIFGGLISPSKINGYCYSHYPFSNKKYTTKKLIHISIFIEIEKWREVNVFTASVTTQWTCRG